MGKKPLLELGDEWNATQLGDVCEIISGGTPSTSNINFWNGKISWCTPTDITATPGKYLERTARKISEEGLRCSAANLLPVGSILLCTRATIGEMKIAKFPVATNQGFKSLIPQEGNNNEFIYYLMLSQKNKLIEKGVGSTFLEISKKDVASLTFNLPSEEEQHKIAQALSDVDALISALDKLIAKKRDFKTATMQQLLTGKKRLPGFEEGQGYKESAIGLIPEDWEIKQLKTVSSMSGRIGWQGLKQEEFTFNDTDPFLITGMNFKDGKIRWDEVYHILEKRYQEAKNIQLEDGDILMTKDGTIGKLLYVENIPFPRKASLNSHLLVFRPLNDSYEPKFLFYQLSSKQFLDYIDLNKSGSTFFGITQEAVGNYSAYLPSLTEQRAIATVLSDMDNAISALESRLAKTQAIKQGMMQELLTGRTRLI